MPRRTGPLAVEQGADLAAGDSYGDTPLHSRARNWRQNIEILIELGADVNHDASGRGTPLHNAADSGKAENVRTLLAHGAHVDPLNDGDQTPLEYALLRCSNAGIEQMAKVAELLIAAGARRSAEAQGYVTRIGESFEFHRGNFNAKSLPATSAALEKLYTLFDVTPVPRRAMHDGKSPIVAKAERWQDQHQELWELLVPSSGAADTVQGEVVRIAGRIANELDGNGGGNWDAGFRQMADAFLAHVGSGNPLPDTALTEAGEVVVELKRKGDDPWRLCKLAVEWVALNPEPVKLPPPPYTR